MDDLGEMLHDDNIFVMNTDTSNGPGIHWLACCCLPNNVLYITDSLGKGNYRPNDEMMQEICDEHQYTIRFYPYKFQLKKSNHCGWYAILICKLYEYLLDERNLTPPSIEEHITELFGKTADVEDEITLAKAFGLIAKS